MWPGPTFEVRKGQPLSIKWSNQLPTKHFLPIDYTIHGSEENVPEVRTVTHVHGAQVLPESDGYPDSWFTSDGKTGSVAGANPTHHPNEQSSRMLWYHDHALGITRLNVYAGLADFYVIRDDQEDALNLPSGPYEIPLMIQDRSFGVDGSLLYPPGQERHPPPVDAGIFRRHNLRERQSRTLPRSRAPQIPLSHGERFELPFFSPDAGSRRCRWQAQWQAGGRSALSSNWNRWRFAARPIKHALLDLLARRTLRPHYRFL